MTSEKMAYARMPRDDFDKVVRISGILGKPHGLRVAMGKAIVKLAESGDHKDFYKALGDNIKQQLPRGMTNGEKAGIVVNTATESEFDAFVEKLDSKTADHLRKLLLAQIKKP